MPPYSCEFTCPNCDDPFEADWTFGDRVRCPHCGTHYETDFDTNTGDDIQGPWLTAAAADERDGRAAAFPAEG